MATINAFTAAQQRASLLANADNSESRTNNVPEVSIELHEFFETKNVVDALNPMRNRNRDGEVFICPGIIVEDTVEKDAKGNPKKTKVYLSTSLINDNFGIPELAQELNIHAHNDIAVVRYEDTPEDTMYITWSKEIFVTKEERKSIVDFFKKK